MNNTKFIQENRAMIWNKIQCSLNKKSICWLNNTLKIKKESKKDSVVVRTNKNLEGKIRANGKTIKKLSNKKRNGMGKRKNA